MLDLILKLCTSKFRVIWIIRLLLLLLSIYAKKVQCKNPTNKKAAGQEQGGFLQVSCQDRRRQGVGGRRQRRKQQESVQEGESQGSCQEEAASWGKEGRKEVKD